MASALALISNLPLSTSGAIGWRHELLPEGLPVGIGDLEFPRGRISEIVGVASSGRTTMLHRILAAGTQRGETCAAVDPMDSFDPRNAAESGVDLDALVWVRCGGNVENALKSADLLVHSGGFGVISLDLCDAPVRELRRIPISWWYRFRRALEATQTILLVLGRQPQAKACASVIAELQRDQTAMNPHLFAGAQFRWVQQKPMPGRIVEFPAETVAAAAAG